MKSRRQEDSKANARVVEIFAIHQNAWQKEERRLIQQIDESSEEIGGMRTRIGELERSENALLGEIDELKREIGERDELLNFMSMRTTSSGEEFDGFGGLDSVGGKYFNGGFGEDRVSEAEGRGCIGGKKGMDGDVGLLFGHSNGGSGCDPTFMSSKFWSERASSWQVSDEYQKKFGESWRTINTNNNAQPWPYLTEALSKYQDPAEADKLLKIQRELDETKIILHKTIDSVLERGERLDSLVEKSSDLSTASQMFYKQAKKTNSCCTLL